MKLFPELPLLRRELTELANRYRTYVVRVVGAVILLFFIFIAYEKALVERQKMFSGLSGPMQFLGIGGVIFSNIVPVLFQAIQLLMPALCCASITAEKESNTIGTLLLTRLSPGTIIVEKFFSRLVPMLTLLLLTFPVLAYVHTLGGVDTDLLIGTLWLLFCECLLIASIAIFCSAWFPSTIAAFIWSYTIIGFLAMLGLSLGFTTFVPSAIWRSAFIDADYNMSRAQVLAMQAVGAIGVVGGKIEWLLIMLRTLPSLIVTGTFLLMARFVLVRRAFVSQASVLLKVFKVVDGFFTRLNDRTTGGIVLITDSSSLPENDPVAWRERNKKSLGKARYLFRVLVALEGPTLFVCMAAATLSARSAFDGLYMLEGLIWTLAVMVTAVKGATLFSSERSRETIAPLLSTSMTAVEMLQQKIVGMRRLILVLAIPVLTVNFTHFMMHFELHYLVSLNITTFRPLTYMLISVVNVFVLLYLTAWLSAGIGLKFHSQTKAVLAAMGVVLAWTTIPLITAFALQPGPIYEEALCTTSPASAVMAAEQFLKEPSIMRRYNQRGEEMVFPRLAWYGISITTYTLSLILLIRMIKSLSPVLLGRLDNPPARFVETPNFADQRIASAEAAS